MQPSRCIAIFDSAPDDDNRVDFIDRGAPALCCELSQVSRLSDAPVDDEETLVRFVVDPFHITNENGKVRLNSSFFNDATTVGASSLRKERATLPEYEAALKELISDKPVSADGTTKRLYGVVLVPVTLARELKHSIETKDPAGKKIVETPRAFGVYATGITNRPSHADIMVNMRSSIAKAKANKAGTKLTTASQAQLLTVEEFKRYVDLTKWAA